MVRSCRVTLTAVPLLTGSLAFSRAGWSVEVTTVATAGLVAAGLVALVSLGAFVVLRKPHVPRARRRSQSGASRSRGRDG